MPADVVTISREELKAKMDRKDDFSLVETLEPAAYEAGHLPGALNLPPGRVRHAWFRRCHACAREKLRLPKLARS